MFTYDPMVENSRQKLNSKVKILKLLLRKEANRVSEKLKYLTGSVSFYKFSHKEVHFDLFSHDKTCQTSNLT